MNNNRDLVRILTEQIRDLRLAANQIERTLEQHLEETETSRREPRKRTSHRPFGA